MLEYFAVFTISLNFILFTVYAVSQWYNSSISFGANENEAEADANHQVGSHYTMSFK